MAIHKHEVISPSGPKGKNGKPFRNVERVALVWGFGFILFSIKIKQFVAGKRNFWHFQYGLFCPQAFEIKDKK